MTDKPIRFLCLAIALGVALIPACGTAADGALLHGRMEGKTYVAPAGGFRCEVQDYELGEISLEDGFAADGGTAKFNGFFNVTRVDFQELEGYSAQQLADSAEARKALYEEYFNSALLPQVQGAIKDTIVLSKGFRAGSPDLFVSVMKLPRVGQQGRDLYRGAVQYADGHSMYVISVSKTPSPGHRQWTEAQNSEDVQQETLAAFGRCTFPRWPTAQGKKT